MLHTLYGAALKHDTQVRDCKSRAEGGVWRQRLEGRDVVSARASQAAAASVAASQPAARGVRRRVPAAASLT